jgi:Protein of unknown function (DUF2970)
MSAQMVAAKKPSFGRSLKTVMWSFVGLRKGAEFQKDIQQTNIMHLIIIGLALGFVFVIGLMFFVRWVVAH